jgi:MFS family permease
MSVARHQLADVRVRGLLVVFFCSGLSVGYFSPLVAALMKDRGNAELGVGLVGTTYYACVALGALLASKHRMNVTRALTATMASAGVLGALLPLATSVLTLALVCGGFGLAVGACTSVAQASLLARTTIDVRALVTGIQALVLAAGLAVGPLLGTWVYAVSPTGAFMLGGALLLVAAASIARRPAQESLGGAVDVPGALHRLFPPVAAAFIYGFAEAALLSVYPLSLMERAIPVRAIGLSCSAFVVGAVVSTLPVSVAADALGRGRVLFSCALAGLGAVAALTLTSQVATVVALSFVAGASIGPVYALALALMSDRLIDQELPSGTAAFNTCFSAGRIAGPIASSLSMAWFGSRGVFVPTLALLLLLVGHGTLSALGAPRWRACHRGW